MNLKKLRIEKQPSYMPNAGQYIGEAEFDNELGTVSINLTPDMCDKLFKVCAEGIINIAKEAAANLTCNVIEQQKTLENKT